MTIPPTLRLRLLAAGLPLLAAVGCSDDSTGPRVPVYPSRGQVFYKGKPLADALLVFKPVAKAEVKGGEVPQPTARTAADGKFLVHTYLGDDGAPVGSYLVGISATPAYSETRNVMQKGSVAPAMPRAAVAAIAARYSSPEKSGLKAEIKAGDNEIPAFNLD